MVPLSAEDFQLYHEQKIFYLFEEKFIYKDKNYKKVKDRCHFTGK